jgi:Fe-S oxidoreductase
MEKTLGIATKRSLPHYARKRFDRWFARNAKRNGASRGKVVLWDDTFVRYHEPNIGIAAVKVLDALGFEVELLQNRKCCGRPAFSQGNLDAAAELGQHNVDLLSAQQCQSGSDLNNSTSQLPILFLEPSCWSMFVEDYRELKIPNAEKIAERCFLFEKFVDDLLEQEPDALRFKERDANVVIHPHCHAKSITKPEFMARLVERLPGRRVTLLDSACCGMAGAFGALAEKYELSKKVAADLLRKIDNAQPDVVVASGTSCRHQIVDLSERWPKHMAELLAEAIE